MARPIPPAAWARMIADVPLGAFLSGGVDSSAVVALMAERFRTDHRVHTVVADDFALINNTLVHHFDEPFADASPFATLSRSRVRASAGTVTVALSGDSADEALAGYRRYKFHAAEERVRGLLPDGVRGGVFGGHRAQYADFKHWLSGDILTKMDRTSMTVILEAREPLLDYRFVEFAATLPASLRIKSRQGKWLMKKALELYLPKDILYRPKMDFVTPVSAWFRSELADEASDLAHPRRQRR